jgi:N-acetylmuramoyl-L-alanine amidase
MRKIVFVLPVILALLFLFISVSGQDVQKKSIKTIIIDPGHGGLDPGARGLFSSEADVSLDVSLKLGKAIEKEFPDMKIIYTRTTDVLPGNKPNKDAALKYRADLANESGGDLFIAVHCNSAGKHPGGWYEKRVVAKIPKYKTVKKKGKLIKKKYYEYRYETYWVENVAKGTETYVWAINKSSAKINSVSKNNDYTDDYSGEIDSTSTITLPDPSDPAEKARMLIYALNYFRKSLNLADFIETGFDVNGRISRGVKQRNDKGIWVLQATGMPSVLVEIGFISNKEEEQYINSEKGQEDIVANIITALKSYKQRLESKISPASDATQ